MIAQTPAEQDERPSVRPTSRTWTDIAVLASLAAIGMVGLTTSFADSLYLVAGIGGIVVGAGAALLGYLLRWPVVTTVLGAIVAYFLFGSAVAMPNEALFLVVPSLQTLSGLAVGAVFGWADLVTLRAPVELPYYVTAVPYVSGWLVMLVSVTLALRWLPGRGGAFRSALVLLGPLALYVVGVLLGTEQPFLAGIRGVAFAAIALIWLSRRRRDSARVASAANAAVRRRRLVGTAVVVGSAVVLGGAGGLLLAPPVDARYVLRDEIQPPLEPLDYPSPLAGFRIYTKDLDETDLFTVDGLAEGERVRIATMDSYDGVIWDVAGAEESSDGSGEFSLVGRTVPVPVDAEDGRRVQLDVSVSGYDDVWLPDIGYATDFGLDRAALADLRYNSSTGTAVLTSGVSDGRDYSVAALVPQPPADTDLVDTPVATIQLAPVENVPDIVTAKALEFSGAATTPIEKLRNIETALKTGGYLSHGTASDSAPSRAGHGADRMTDLLTLDPMVGDQEQYASAFALMARSLDYPARVVMGFAPEVPAEGGPVTVTGGDVTAWVEVAFDGVGWISFDPTPDDTDVPQSQVPRPQTEPQPQVRQPPRAENEQEDLVNPTDVEDNDEDEDRPFVLPGWVLVLALSLLIPLLIIVVPLVIVALIKRRRERKRRSQGSGDDRVAGAWAELLDRYAELGYPIPEKLTRPLTARELENTVVGAEAGSLVGLAHRADDAVFSGRSIDDAAAEQVWTEALGAAEIARAAASGARRLRSRYRLRSLADRYRALVRRAERSGDARDTRRGDRA
ncbi:transglutaminase domain-containing protein [Herbiconiux sp. L3-i23]|uniref:transglutaminase family protein n=1 Tax=Herbiconiux sp. L3-i23 TaxID=2905871 RepID=UPI00206DB07B|nr:transglutaminase domain-containing protein [Herbiconiux sp. L3-i23]BDI21813.1 cysteine protease [Herbiconiux sp. L3-i23]